MKALRIVIILLLIAIVSFLLYRNIPFFTPSSRTNEGKILLKTHWMGEGDYVKFTPELNTHGCWSTTFSQIAYYHRLQLSSISNYECSLWGRYLTFLIHLNHSFN
jgi:hypothetical protein